MRLILENIGLLKKAEMDLNGLSVIAGENDNGKSTVGKIVFCLIKAINAYKETIVQNRYKDIQNEIHKLLLDLNDSSISNNSLLNAELFNTMLLFREDNYEIFVRVLDKFINDLEIHDTKKANNIRKKQIKIEELLRQPQDENKAMENALMQVFASEFDSKVLLEGKNSGLIQLYEKNSIILHIKINATGISVIKMAQSMTFKDATFIETPLILNNYDLLIRSQTAIERLRKKGTRTLGVPYTTLHTKDLFDKLIELPFSDLFHQENDQSLSNLIDSVIHGKINHNRKEGNFYFEKNGKSISIKNTASGIKIFGIIQLLIKNNFVNKNTLLIFDEPENHLHPKWQLKLAEMLVNLSKFGVCILVSSHSPYMIEALKRYSDHEKIKEKTNFYLAKDNEIQNQNKLEEIFQILSEPFEIFRKMDRESLKDE